MSVRKFNAGLQTEVDHLENVESTDHGFEKTERRNQID